MNKKRLVTVIVLISMFLISSCSKNKDVDSTISKDNDKNIVIIDNGRPNADNLNTVESEDETNKLKSKLNGLKYDKELLENRPIMVSIDNHPNARWQAGLNDAEIVYEVEAEWPYTRYLAVFQTKEPKLIGPVRSARPYMIYLSLEYDSLFAHVGGSDEAFRELKELKVADIDGLYTSNMWRYSKTNKYAPHNVYTDLDSIRLEANQKKYRTEEFEFDGFLFNEGDTDLNSEAKADYIEITYNNENKTKYCYDKDNKIYIRYKDGRKHIDENNNNQITAKNIIIYEVDKKVLDNEGRLYLGVIGQGAGYYITNGKAVEITWNKDSEKSQTKFYYKDEELKLNPGNTWIQVVNDSKSIQFPK